MASSSESEPDILIDFKAVLRQNKESNKLSLFKQKEYLEYW